jgi:hypothetical protein
MDNEATIRARLTQIATDLRTVPSISASLLTEEYTKRHGADGCIRKIAAALLAKMFDPVVRAARK